ncbi:hypothetical protein ACFO4E_15585 [Nocardiopsis mangrovi]|uniref:PQQ-binding-like beta-propeller repeat protein n=1 Tax=Nocardiopsis mangrovi TaxID=1179818 RepID=A0ABV9DZE3_9ACTN
MSLAAVVGVLGMFSLFAAGVAAAAVLALIACQVPRRDGTPLVRAPGIVLVAGEIVLFGAASAAAWAAWPPPAVLVFCVLITVDVIVRLDHWDTLTTVIPGRAGRIAARTAAATTAALVAAGLLSPWYWSPAAEAVLCARPTVQQGASDAWPDARPLDQRDPTREDSPLLDAAEDFDGNAAFGTAAWWTPFWGGMATGNSTSVAMVDVDGLGVYDAADGHVKWTLDSARAKWELNDDGTHGIFGWISEGGRRTISGDLVHTVGDTLLVHLRDGYGPNDLPRIALLALDVETGDRLWCAPGVTHLQFDPAAPDRVAVYDDAWRLLDTSDGRTVAAPDIDLTPLAAEAPEEPEGRPLFYRGPEPTEKAVLGGGRLVLTRGPAIAVYDAADGSPIHDATLPAPHGDADEDGHAVYNAIADETATVVEVDCYDAQSDPHGHPGPELVAFNPAGEELWRSEGSIGDYGPSGTVPPFGGVFITKTTAIHIGDGSEAWELPNRIGQHSGSRHQVRDGFLYADVDGAPVAIDFRDGGIIPAPLADQLEAGDSDVAHERTVVPAGIVLAQSSSVPRPAETATVMFGPPTPAE